VSWQPFSYPEGQNPAEVCIRSQGTRTSRATVATSLRALARILSGGTIEPEAFPWHALRYHHLTVLRRHLATTYKPAGANVKLAHLRAVLAEAWRLEWMDTDAYTRARSVRNARGLVDVAGRDVPDDERERLFAAAAADPTVRGRRDLAILALLVATALRCTEVRRADLAHLKGDDLRLRGKGHKGRTLDVSAARPELDAWLAVRGRRQGALFWPIGRRRELEPRRISTAAIRDVCARRAREAGIPHVTPHDLRRTTTTNLLEAPGVDLLVVSDILGHAKTDTTRRYDRRPDEARRAALQRVRVPRPARRAS